MGAANTTCKDMERRYLDLTEVGAPYDVRFGPWELYNNDDHSISCRIMYDVTKVTDDQLHSLYKTLKDMYGLLVLDRDNTILN